MYQALHTYVCTVHFLDTSHPRQEKIEGEEMVLGWGCGIEGGDESEFPKEVGGGDKMGEEGEDAKKMLLSLSLSLPTSYFYFSFRM